MEDSISIQMYGLKKLDQHVRKTFNLPCSPYDEDNSQALLYLQNLGIVFFRDEVHPRAILIEPSEGGPIQERRGFQGFKFMAKCDDDGTYTPQQWVDDDVDPDALGYNDYVKKYGDDRSWLWWNESTHIVRITKSFVRCA